MNCSVQLTSTGYQSELTFFSSALRSRIISRMASPIRLGERTFFSDFVVGLEIVIVAPRGWPEAGGGEGDLARSTKLPSTV